MAVFAEKGAVAPPAGDLDASPPVDLEADESESSVEEANDAKEKQHAQFPLWKLVLSAIPWIGIQALWSTEFAVTTPYMEDLGMSKAWASNIWVFGPLTGFVTAPVVGSLSDRCRSRFGRRRPFIFGGLIMLWAASLIFASSRHILPAPYSKWLAMVMFVVLDVVVNVIQTPIRAIVSDMASQEQQVDGQIISVLFQGIGNLLGFGIMKIWQVPFQAIFQVMVLVLSILTVFVALQVWICKEVPYEPPKDAPRLSIVTPFASAFGAIRNMPRDLAKIAFVQFFSWYSLFSYLPTVSTWFGVNVFEGSADKDSPLHHRYEEGQDANSIAGLFNSGLMIVFSMLLVGLMLKTSIPVRYLYSACLFVGAVALILAKTLVGQSLVFALIIVSLMAVPMSAANAFPFALVGAMNKSNEEAGQETDTGVQMGVLNVFVCTPQLVATLVVGTMRHRLEAAALPWAYLIAAVSFVIAGLGALIVNDRLVSTGLQRAARAPRLAQ